MNYLNDKKFNQEMFDVGKLYDGLYNRNEIKIPITKDYKFYFDYWKDFQNKISVHIKIELLIVYIMMMKIFQQPKIISLVYLIDASTELDGMVMNLKNSVRNKNKKNNLGKKISLNQVEMKFIWKIYIHSRIIF